MNGRARSALRILTFLLCIACAWGVYSNVLGDDTEVRTRAEATARQHAGCGERCKLTGIQGSRGMLQTRLTYDFDGRTTSVVTCRRALIIFGDYSCEAVAP